MKPTLSLKMIAKTYNDAINALNSLQSNYANIMAIREAGIRKNEMSLLEMREWARRIGYSTKDFNQLNVIHITGTKGKGSTAAFTSSILQKYQDKLPKIGLYTSPHLRTVRERIRINGKPISEDKFTKYFFDVWNKLDATTSSLEVFPHMTPGSKPGYFKYLTLLSFHTFMQEGCNSCVYEVGIGGEYDSTNIIEKPVACGVSLLGIDHTYMLGDTIDEIAWNKGGIFKDSTPAFTVSGQPSKGLQVLEERAAERNTVLKEVPIFKELDEINLGIAGEFQKSNASLAVCLATQALKSLNIIDTEVPLQQSSQLLPNVIEGLKDTQWEGRCQTFKKGKNNWYLDGAHTMDSMTAASGWYKDITAKSSNKKIFLFNQQTRDAAKLLENLDTTIGDAAKFDLAIFSTNVTWESGTYSADLVSMNTSKEEVENLSVQQNLATEWNKLHKDCETVVTPSIETAVKKIESLSNEPVDIFVTGSLHLVGGLLVVFDDNN
ncbi:folylpolyglutamate synthase [Monosporozyma unispora]